MISPLRMLAHDSDVCPVSVTCPVAPLNTYTFLKICFVRSLYKWSQTFRLLLLDLIGNQTSDRRGLLCAEFGRRHDSVGRRASRQAPRTRSKHRRRALRAACAPRRLAWTHAIDIASPVLRRAMCTTRGATRTSSPGRLAALTRKGPCRTWL